MRKQIILLLSAVLILMGCDNGPSPVASAEQNGNASMNIKMNKVGLLAKVSTMNLEQLILEFTSPGQVSVFDTIAVSGISQSTVAKTYTLASRVDWTVHVYTLNTEGEIIHEQTETFMLLPRQTTEVAVDMDAEYSVLNAHFFPIRDSVTKVELVVDGVVQDSTVFAKQTRVGDTISLNYDYVTTGGSHDVTLNVFGEWWGIPYLLYTGELTETVTAGQDTALAVSLVWVGPMLPPDGDANMTVVIGKIGTVEINGYIGLDETVVRGFAGRTVTYSNIDINGTGTNMTTVRPGDQVTVTTSWVSQFTSTYCPGCIQQYYIGVRDLAIDCMYSGGTSSNRSGNGSITFTAPTTEGVYPVQASSSLQYSCTATAAGMSDNPAGAIGYINVSAEDYPL